LLTHKVRFFLIVQKKNTSIKGGAAGRETERTIIFCGKLSFILSFVCAEHPFILSALNAATYIFTAPTHRTTIITLNPFTLNAEFQHFINRFNKISSLCRYH
jgi:hypothetical protein